MPCLRLNYLGERLLRVVRFDYVVVLFQPKSHTNCMLLGIDSSTALLALLHLQIMLGVYT